LKHRPRQSSKSESMLNMKIPIWKLTSKSELENVEKERSLWMEGRYPLANSLDVFNASKRFSTSKSMMALPSVKHVQYPKEVIASMATCMQV
jgi:hypothetical protein